MIPQHHLWRLRNEIKIEVLIKKLNVLSKESEGYLRFQCPSCKNLNTAVNPRSNMGRCFGCERNFNTIELQMEETGDAFLEAVAYLEGMLRS